MDLLIQILILGLLPLANFFVIRHTKRWLNPLTIISVTFFLPLFFSLFRWSGLQASSWHDNTYAVILSTLMFWALVPAIFLLLQKTPQKGAGKYELDDGHLRSKIFAYTTRGFAAIVVASWFVANYLQTGLLVPFSDPEAAYRVHAEFPPVIRFFARANLAAVALLFVSYYYNRRSMELVLLLCILLVPITRLSRIDLFMSCVILLALNSFFPVVRIKLRNVLVAGCLLLTVVVVSVELGNQRLNRFGQYEIKYEDAILWRPAVTGPYGMFPVLYGYFPLSFENFDQYVRMSRGRHGYGIMSMDWLFTGILKIHKLQSFQELRSQIDQYRVSVAKAATVPSSLLPFYADFGAAGSGIPMFICMMVWVMFYRRASSSPLSALLYGLYSGAFGLAAFQPIIVAPLVINQMFEVAILLFVIRMLWVRSAKSAPSARSLVEG